MGGGPFLFVFVDGYIPLKKSIGFVLDLQMKRIVSAGSGKEKTLEVAKYDESAISISDAYGYVEVGVGAMGILCRWEKWPKTIAMYASKSHTIGVDEYRRNIHRLIRSKECNPKLYEELLNAN